LAFNGITPDIPVNWHWADGVGPHASSVGVSSGNTNPVTGGIVSSYAKGSENFHVNSGTSLTGEEGPEIIWNKDGKYAYITG